MSGDQIPSAVPHKSVVPLYVVPVLFHRPYSRFRHDPQLLERIANLHVSGLVLIVAKNLVIMILEGLDRRFTIGPSLILSGDDSEGKVSVTACIHARALLDDRTIDLPRVGKKSLLAKPWITP